MASNYENEKLISSGSYGSVYKALDKANKRKVAIKMINNGDYGVDKSGLREVRYLKSMDHPNIIKLLNIYSTDGALYLVMELAVCSLLHIIHERRDIDIQTSHIKRYMLMILSGVSFLHSRFILHRDLKPGNLMVSSDGTLKIIDFGLSRSFGSPRVFSHTVMTTPYRPPEMIMKSTYYSTAVDMWSVGCVLAELLQRRILFDNVSDSDPIRHLKLIFSLFGTPIKNDWKDAHLLPEYYHFEHRVPMDLTALFAPDLYKRRQEFSSVSRSAAAASVVAMDSLDQEQDQSLNYDDDDCAEVDLIDRLMKLNPLTRITADDALKHKYFTLGPLPSSIEDLPSTPK